MIHFIYERVFFIFGACFLFVVDSCDVGSVLAMVALLSADLAKMVFWILFFVSCGRDGGVDMITYTAIAQSFLTSILRVGVCVIVSLIFTRVLAHGFCRAR